MAARIVLFALDDLRKRYGELVPEGADPRADTTPFRAFRDALLAAAAGRATAPAEVSMWWEGTYNGYFLAVAFSPAEALPANADFERACYVDGERVGEPRRDAHPLARVEPGRSRVAQEGGAWEAPFGAAAGHFGAPGFRKVNA